MQILHDRSLKRVVLHIFFLKVGFLLTFPDSYLLMAAWTIKKLSQETFQITVIGSRRRQEQDTHGFSREKV